MFRIKKIVIENIIIKNIHKDIDLKCTFNVVLHDNDDKDFFIRLNNCLLYKDVYYYIDFPSDIETKYFTYVKLPNRIKNDILEMVVLMFENRTLEYYDIFK